LENKQTSTTNGPPLTVVETSKDIVQASDSVTAQVPPTPEPEVDPALRDLAIDREALLRQLGKSTSSLQLGPSVSVEPAEDSKANGAIQQDVPPPQEADAPSKDSETSQTAHDNDDARSTTSRPSLSIKSPSGWLRALLQGIFGALFGALFAPFRRRTKSPTVRNN